MTDLLLDNGCSGMWLAAGFQIQELSIDQVSGRANVTEAGITARAERREFEDGMLSQS